MIRSLILSTAFVVSSSALVLGSAPDSVSDIEHDGQTMTDILCKITQVVYEAPKSWRGSIMLRECLSGKSGPVDCSEAFEKLDLLNDYKELKVEAAQLRLGISEQCPEGPQSEIRTFFLT